jgi:hypothetical protein
MGMLRVAVVVMAALVFAAQRPQEPSGGLPPGGRGLIAGQVVDPGTGKPVPEAVVSLRIGFVLGPETPRVLTDAQGRFVFVNVPPGQYRLMSEKLGYATGYFGQRVLDGATGSIDLADRQILTDVSLPMSKFAAIGGTVTDEAGEPVVGIRVEAFRKAISFGRVRLEPYDPYNQAATTDDRGIYRLSSLPPGEYAVAASSTLATLPMEVLPAIGTPSPVRTQAFMAAREIGRLGDPGNQQVGELLLLTTSRTLIPPAPVGSDFTTVYRTTFAPATPLPADATVIAIGSGEERSGINIVLRPSRAVRVSGRLVGPDGPVAHTMVSLMTTGRWQVAFQRSIGPTATTVSDGAGRFTMLGVPEGEYIVSVLGGEPRVGVTAGSEPIVVGDSDIADLTVNVRRAPRVTGHFDLGGRAPPIAQPGTSGSLYVIAEPLDPGRWSFALVPQGTSLNFESFVFVPPGVYAIGLRSPSGVTCTAAMVQGRDISDELFVVGSADIDMTVRCTDAPTRLSGTVRGDSGNAELDAAVVAFPTERRFWSGPSIRVRRFQSAYPDASGKFTLLNLPPGEYFVATIPLRQAELWQDPNVLDTLTRSATRTTLGPGESRVLDLKIARIR